MAFNTPTERAVTISIDLGGIIAGKVSAVVNVRQRERAVQEAKFQQTVIDQGLSYEAQVEYRKKQIEEEKKKPSPDLDYVTELEGSVSSLRQLNRFQKIREDYLSNYEALKSGRISLKDHERFLQSQLAGAKDQQSRDEIRQELSQVRTQISESEINVLNNRVLLASKDGTVASLESAIEDVSKRKAFADLAGNEEESTAWDVSLLSLRKQLTETNIANSLNDIDLSITRRGGSAVEKLNMLNEQIQGADGRTPITVAGVTYGSAKEFWQGTRDSYIQGTGTDKNFQSFFSEFESEVKSKVDTVSKINNYGFVPVATLESIQNDYRSLGLRSEFQNSLDKIQSSSVAALSYGVDKSAEALITSSVETLQLNSGLEALRSLETKFGVDLKSRQAELNQQIISKGSQLEGIKNATQQLGRVGAETPATTIPDELTPGEIFKQNNQPGAGSPATPPNLPTPEAPGTNPAPTDGMGAQSDLETPAATPTPAPAAAPKFASSKGQASVVDYLRSQKLDSSFQNRAKLFEERGLGKANEFTGAAEQNTKLLKSFE